MLRHRCRKSKDMKPNSYYYTNMEIEKMYHKKCNSWWGENMFYKEIGKKHKFHFVGIYWCLSKWCNIKVRYINCKDFDKQCMLKKDHLWNKWQYNLCYNFHYISNLMQSRKCNMIDLKLNNFYKN